MSYCTEAQLVERYGSAMLIALTDRAPVPTGTIDATVVARALADTDALIDGYLARRYALPLTVAQPLLTDLALSIAIWKLHLAQPDPKIEADFNAAIKTLAAVSLGTIALTAAGVEAPGTGGTGVQVTDRERPMTAENLKGFI
jgi:phage gp36-like protein